MNNDRFVIFTQKEELYDVAIELLEQGYEEHDRQDTQENPGTVIFVDNVKKHYFFVNAQNLAQINDLIVDLYKQTYVPNNLNQLKTWKTQSQNPTSPKH
jgi:hypothetical protein